MILLIILLKYFPNEVLQAHHFNLITHRLSHRVKTGGHHFRRSLKNEYLKLKNRPISIVK